MTNKEAIERLYAISEHMKKAGECFKNRCEDFAESEAFKRLFNDLEALGLAMSALNQKEGKENGHNERSS